MWLHSTVRKIDLSASDWLRVAIMTTDHLIRTCIEGVKVLIWGNDSESNLRWRHEAMQKGCGVYLLSAMTTHNGSDTIPSGTFRLQTEPPCPAAPTHIDTLHPTLAFFKNFFIFNYSILGQSIFISHSWLNIKFTCPLFVAHSELHAFPYLMISNNISRCIIMLICLRIHMGNFSDIPDLTAALLEKCFSLRSSLN